MDSYIFLKDKKTFEKDCLKQKEYDEKVKEYHSFIDEMIEKYPQLKGKFSNIQFVRNTITKEEDEKWLDLCKKTYNAFDDKGDDDSTELNYWSNAYPLHHYIAKHFLEDKTNDNCRAIILSKDGIEKMIESMKNCLGRFSECKRNIDAFYNHEYYDEKNLEQDIKFFTRLLSMFNNNIVIFYYSWY